MTSSLKTYLIIPVPAPRMTQSDRWNNRACVVRYFDFRDRVKELNISVVNGDKVTFYLPIPKSWSKKKQAQHDGMPHRQTPDIDNLLKALLDSIYENDSHIYSVWPEKRWSHSPRIEVEAI